MVAATSQCIRKGFFSWIKNFNVYNYSASTNIVGTRIPREPRENLYEFIWKMAFLVLQLFLK